MLSEIVYGIITALAVTNAIWFTLGGSENDALVISATLLINGAWGLSDSIIYLLRASIDKNISYHGVNALKNMNEADAKDFIEENLDGTVVSALDPSDKAKVINEVYRFSTKTKPVKLTLDKWDVMGAAASFFLYVVSAVPILVPHIFFFGMLTPIILSNIIGVILMFLMGYVWAGRTHGAQFKAGMIMAISGVIMIIVITLVGG